MAMAIGEATLGDKSPKAKNKGAKQKDVQTKKDVAKAKTKQEKAPVATPGKKK